MCYRPIHIWNNSNHFNSCKPVQFECACGSCESCLDVRRFDWYVRAYYEHKQALSNNGLTVAFTLTFDDEHVNHFHGRTAFDSRIFPKFIKRLRSYLKQYFPSYVFRYAAFPEYGETYQRPHYHVIFNIFCTDQFRPSSRHFYLAVLKTWQQGFIHVKRGSNYGIIQSFNALRYATKYVTKSHMFYDTFWINYSCIRSAYKQYLYDNAFNALSLFECYSLLKQDSHNKYLHKYYRLFADARNILFPSVHITLGYGSPAIQSMDKLHYDHETIRVLVSNRYVDAPLPLYLRRKLYYSRIPNERDGKLTRYVLSDSGLEHKINFLPYQISKLAQDYDTMVSQPYSRLMLEDMNKVLSTDFRSPLDLNYYLNYYRDRFVEVAIYALVYKGTIFHPLLGQFDPFIKDVYISHYRLTHSLIEHENDDSLSETSNRKYYLQFFHETKVRFELHDRLFRILSFIRNYQEKESKSAKVHDQSLLKKYNDQLKKESYEKGNNKNHT